MIAQLRYAVSRLFPETLKFKLSLSASQLTYGLLKSLKGIAPLWADDPDFEAAYKIAAPRILLDKGRAFMLFQLAKRQRAIAGEFVELGAYQCGTATLLTGNDTLTDKTITFIDSFEGLPEVTEKDPFWQKGDMSGVSLEEIKTYLASAVPNAKVDLKKGFFPQEVDLEALPQAIAFLHIDTDLYQPTKDALELLYARLTPGGAILIDDYGNLSCPGVTQAVDEYSAQNSVQPLFLVTGQALLIKL